MKIVNIFANIFIFNFRIKNNSEIRSEQINLDLWSKVDKLHKPGFLMQFI